MLSAGDQDTKMEMLDVRAYMSSNGFVECASNDPDVFIHVSGKPDASFDGGYDIKHFARKFTDGPSGTDHLLESKLGEYLRITHEKNGLDGPNSNYGDRILWFKVED